MRPLSLLILATSPHPEPEPHPGCAPRSDYMELAKSFRSTVLDYNRYAPGSGGRLWGTLEKKSRMDWRLALAGKRIARQFDVVLLMSERIAIPYMMLEKLRPGPKATRIGFVSAHSSEKQRRLISSLRLFDSLSLAVSNAHAQRDFFVDGLRIREDKIRYIRYAVDDAFYTPAAGPAEPENMPYIFSAGGLAGRDYATLFAAAAELPYPVKIAAAGRAYGRHTQASLPPPPSNVEMLPRHDFFGMRDLYRKARCVVVPLPGNRQDGAGCSVVLEAMCSGKASIVSATGGMRDYVTDEVTGKLVTPHDPDQMRTALNTLWTDDEKARSWGACARHKASGELSFNSFVGHLRRTVEEL